MEDIIAEINNCEYKLNSYIYDCFYNLKNENVFDEKIKEIINNFYETFLEVDKPLDILIYDTPIEAYNSYKLTFQSDPKYVGQCMVNDYFKLKGTLNGK